MDSQDTSLIESLRALIVKKDANNKLLQTILDARDAQLANSEKRVKELEAEREALLMQIESQKSQPSAIQLEVLTKPNPSTMFSVLTKKVVPYTVWPDPIFEIKDGPAKQTKRLKLYNRTNNDICLALQNMSMQSKVVHTGIKVELGEKKCEMESTPFSIGGFKCMKLMSADEFLQLTQDRKSIEMRAELLFPSKNGGGTSIIRRPNNKVV